MMPAHKTALVRTLLFLATITLAGTVPAEPPQPVNLAFFEAGRCLGHDILRDEFTHQLKQLAGEEYEFIPIPQGYKSAGWYRDSSRIKAAELVALGEADVVIAMGPWTVEDLLAAGCDKPIVALNRVDPVAEGLVDEHGRPVASNLTLQVRPSQVARDIDALTRLVTVRRLGVLYFPTGDEQDKIVSQLEALGRQRGFEVVAAEGFDNKGAYAFFKAYHSLAGKVDAVYIFPMFAMDGIKIREFFIMTTRDKMPTFVWEGAYLVQRGALASNSGFSVIPAARHAAVNLLEIIKGATPADLPVAFDVAPGVAINEATAKACGIEIPTTMQHEMQLVPAPPSDEGYHFGFNDALRQALDANPSHLGRYDALEASIQAARQAYSDYLPQVRADFSVTRSDGSINTLSDSYRTGVHLRQTIFSLETIRAIQAAAERRHIEQVNLRRSQLDLELAVALAYLDYLQAEEAYGLYIDDRNRVDRFLELTYTRREREDAPQRDVTRWEQERHQATIRVTRAANDTETAGVILNALLNLPGHSDLTLDSTGFDRPSMVNDYRRLFSRFSDRPAQERLGDLLVGEAMVHSPEIDRHRAQIELQRKLLAQNRARFLPTLSLEASYDYTDLDYHRETGWPEYYDHWWTRLELRLPLFMGGSRFREQGKQKALLSLEEYRRDEASLRVMREVLTNFDDLVALAANMPSYARAGELALNELQPVIDGYEAGTIPLIDVLDAQRNSLSARINSLDARYRFYRTLVRLSYWIGWSSHERSRRPGDLFFNSVSELTAGDG